MDGTGFDVTNRIRIGSHTASDVRKTASRMHCTYTLCEPGYVRQRPPSRGDRSRSSRYVMTVSAQSGCHARHPMIPSGHGANVR